MRWVSIDMNILDLITPRGDYTATGKYYNKMPSFNDHGAEGIRFKYAYLDPKSKQYQRVFSQVVSTEGNTLTIKTNQRIPFKVGGFITTQEGELYVIESINKDYQSVNKQAYFIASNPAGLVSVLRLIQVDNPWEIK